MSTPIPMSASSDRSNELRINYGGQAVLEGVMMRGRRVAATAVRHPAGHIVLKAEALDPRRLSQRLRPRAVRARDGGAVGNAGPGTARTETSRPTCNWPRRKTRMAVPAGPPAE